MRFELEEEHHKERDSAIQFWGTLCFKIEKTVLTR